MTASLAARLGLVAAATAGFAVAGAWSVRAAMADYWFQKETAEGTRRAIALEPENSAYLVRLALLVGDEHAAEARSALQRAVALNPNDARAWIELGLRLEADGDGRGAEQDLLRAAQEDRTYLPRWTLANFYFRRGDEDRFWHWANAAAPMIYGDPLPLFHLCGRMEEDGRLLERLDIRKPQIEAAYLFYLLDTGHAELAGPASRRLLEGNRDSDVPLLLEACDRLIDARRMAEAGALWNGLLASHRLPFVPPDGNSSLVTNGDFAVSPTGHGFDWRLADTPGVSAAREESPHGLRLTFSGMQPERAEPLTQFIAARANTWYQLKFGFLTSGMAAPTGLAWEIRDADANRPLAQGEELVSDAGSAQQVRFLTPAGCGLLRLNLVYRRRPGTTRIAGYLILRDVELRRWNANQR